MRHISRNNAPYSDRTDYERGPPPCQIADCNDDAHFRTGYVHCLDHDYVDPPPEISNPQAVGIATDDFRFFFGASCGSSRKALKQAQEPNVMLSYATASNSPWDDIETLMVDSGGYSLIEKGGGEYPDTIDDYLDYVDGSGADYYVTRDIPTDPSVLGTLDRGVNEAISRTVDLTAETLDRHSDRDIDARPMAVLQGDTPQDYVSCYHELVRADALTSRLAIGSLKRQDLSTRQIVDIITTVSAAVEADTLEDEPCRELHALGVDVEIMSFPSVQRALTSADSSRYIASTRWRANREELPPRLREDEPRTEWYDVLEDYLAMRTDLRTVLDPDRQEQARETPLANTTQATFAESATAHGGSD